MSHDRLRVRDATAEDAAEIAAIQVAGWKAAYRGIMPDKVLDGLDLTDRTRRWGEILARGQVRHLVVEDDRRLTGFAGYGPTRGTDASVVAWELYSFYIDPAEWGKGYGRALWRGVEERLSAGGCLEVALWVFEANHRARTFYERLGFTSVGHIQTRPEFGAVEVRYRKAIAAG